MGGLGGLGGKLPPNPGREHEHIQLHGRFAFSVLSTSLFLGIDIYSCLQKSNKQQTESKNDEKPYV